MVKNRTIELTLLLLIFVGTVFARVDTIGRPPADGHEWLTAHTVIVHSVWNQRGIVSCNFAQCMNYDRAEDEYINNAQMSNYQAHYPHDGNGVYYYFSHPPLGVIAPYLVFKLLQIKPSFLAIHWFNIALGLICSLIIYLTILCLSRAGSAFNPGAVIGAGIFQTLPGNLWFFANVYYIEMFAMLPIAVVLLCCAHWRRCQQNNSKASLSVVCLAGSLLLLCFTDWVGYLFAGFLFLYSLITWKRHQDHLFVAVTCVAPVAALTLFTVQHSWIVGFEEFYAQLAKQFLYRSGAEAPSDGQPIASISLAVDYYMLAGIGAICLSIALAGLSLFLVRPLISLRKYIFVIALSAVPIVLHHFLLQDYFASHYFSVHKGLYVFALVVGFLSYELLKKPYGLSTALTMLVIVGVISYSYPITLQNHDFYRFRNIDMLYLHTWLASVINNEAHADEVIFLADIYLKPQTISLLQRNVKSVVDVEEARQWMMEHSQNSGKAIVFHSFHGTNYVSERFSLPR